jgi:RimJ/RimL family protein N-acetyltransferase
VIVPEALLLSANRVSLRRLTDADAAAMFAMFSLPEVMRYWSRPAMTEMAQAEALLQQVLTDYRSGDSLPLGLERNCDRLLVGNCTLH